jgi:hypothetical protein
MGSPAIAMGSPAIDEERLELGAGVCHESAPA